MAKLIKLTAPSEFLRRAGEPFNFPEDAQVLEMYRSRLEEMAKGDSNQYIIIPSDPEWDLRVYDLDGDSDKVEIVGEGCLND